MEIDNHLPPISTTPYEQKEILKMYQTLVCTTVLDKEQFLVMLSISLLAKFNKFEISDIFSISVPIKNPKLPNDNLPKLVAWYNV